MTIERTGDLILPQGTYILVQDGASGQVEVIVGPHKVSLADTDKPVIYDEINRTYQKVASQDAMKVFPSANEGQYIVLSNPAKEDASKHPSKGKQQSIELNTGNKVNIPGPITFPLFPGQTGTVIQGHQLKSNEYLIARVYNEEQARKNIKNAIIRPTGGEEDQPQQEEKPAEIQEKDLVTGRLLIIKGTDVSFYIPPTGIEVLKENGKYVQDAVTLERLEYCILLDQNGTKRYVQGPAVVFPKPTESFVTNENGGNKFKAIELNENMGIYVKIIDSYEENNKKYLAGDEEFITGKETKIYFPRPEHAIIKYGDHIIHYAVALPAGEARYVLNKETGSVDLIKGPKMFLPDPRKEVIVKRKLDDKTVSLWFPGNQEALLHNRNLASDDDFTSIHHGDLGNSDRRMMKSRVSFASLGDEIQRSSSYTKPRMISLDTKFDGVVSINVWPGYAIQIIKKSGDRRVVIGPKVVMLDYDETLEVLELSTGKPKNDISTIKTAYLQVSNNIVSDSVTAETKDSVSVHVSLSYRVNFIKEDEKWFNVSNYVKLLTEHTRSLIRNTIKKNTIEHFNINGTDIIRNIVLGTQDKENSRPGRFFDENNMNIYDVEVLNITIGDAVISDLLREAQHQTVESNLRIAKQQSDLEETKKIEAYKRAKIQEEAQTSEIKSKAVLEQTQADKVLSDAKIQIEVSKQKSLNELKQEEVSRLKMEQDQELNFGKEQAIILKDKMSSIQPGLIEALITISTVSTTEILAKNLKSQQNGLTGLLGQGGFEGLLNTVKGTPLEDQVLSLIDKYKELKERRSIKESN